MSGYDEFNGVQKAVFLASEGDAWFKRNRDALAKRKLPEEDPILRELLDLFAGAMKSPRILEIGCGEGLRLEWLNQNLGASCTGVEPSAQAVEAARAHHVDVRRGTADELPFDAASFDVIIFGFCLYLCDREDLFRIAGEANRVLAPSGWIVIEDFFSPAPRARPYHHKAGVNSYKMDYRTMFSWHPDYLCVTQKVRSHGNAAYADDPENWVAVSVLRKRPRISP